MYMISCSIPLSTKAMDSIWNGFIVAAFIVMVTVMILIVYIDSKNNAIISESRRQSKPTDAGESYMIEDTVKLADEMKGVTILHARTNKGKNYKSSLTRHSEIVFIENSPCYNCAQHLITHFKSCHTKPDMFIGNIYQQQNKEDDKGLQDLMKECCDIQVWESFHQDLQITRNHLLCLGQNM